jgi:hypothetical protein
MFQFSLVKKQNCNKIYAKFFFKKIRQVVKHNLKSQR